MISTAMRMLMSTALTGPTIDIAAVMSMLISSVATWVHRMQGMQSVAEKLREACC
jgi:uncharacterized membrane protein